MVLSLDNTVVKMMMILLAKIAKLSWFNDQDVRSGLVPQILQIMAHND